MKQLRSKSRSGPLEFFEENCPGVEKGWEAQILNTVLLTLEENLSALHMRFKPICVF